MGKENKKLKADLEVSQSQCKVKFNQGNAWRKSAKKVWVLHYQLFTTLGATLKKTKLQNLIFGYRINLEALGDIAKANKVELAVKRKQVMPARAQREKEFVEQNTQSTEQVVQASNDQSLQVQSSK